MSKVIEVFSGKSYSFFSFNTPIGTSTREDFLSTECLFEVENLKRVQKDKGMVQFKRSFSFPSIDPGSDKGLMKIGVINKLYSEGSLAHLLFKKRDSLSYLDRLLIAKQLIDSVCTLHQKDMVHRDIKPANILVKMTKRGHYKVVLSDLSSLCSLSQKAKLSELKTTGMFSSPELALAYLEGNPDKIAEASKKSLDIWSLGIVLFELFYLKKPEFFSKIAKDDQSDLIKQLSYVKNLNRIHLPITATHEARMLSRMLAQEPRPSIAEIKSFFDLL